MLPLLKSVQEQVLVQRTLADHQRLRALLRDVQKNDVAALDEFGKCLAAHVRFEERELFAVLESLLQGSKLNDLE